MTKKKNTENSKFGSKGHLENDVSKQTDTDKVGQPNNETANLDNFEKYLEPKLKLKRIYRSREDLPDPARAPDAETNRSAVRLSARVSRHHELLFNKLAKDFPSKRAAIERAIDLLAKDKPQDYDVT